VRHRMVAPMPLPPVCRTESMLDALTDLLGLRGAKIYLFFHDGNPPSFTPGHSKFFFFPPHASILLVL